MIRLTRLRNSNPLYINPDHIERLEQHHETTVHLFNGDEFVVTESAEKIVELITEQRARILALASRFAADRTVDQAADVPGSVDVPGSADVPGSVSGTSGSVSPLITMLDQPDGGSR